MCYTRANILHASTSMNGILYSLSSRKYAWKCGSTTENFTGFQMSPKHKNGLPPPRHGSCINQNFNVSDFNTHSIKIPNNKIQLYSILIFPIYIYFQYIINICIIAVKIYCVPSNSFLISNYDKKVKSFPIFQIHGKCAVRWSRVAYAAGGANYHTWAP